MRCCGFGGAGFLGAFADRLGAIESNSGFIIVFIVVLVLTAAWGDIARMLHLKPQPAVQTEAPVERI
jgi:hypothetical protein